LSGQHIRCDLVPRKARVAGRDRGDRGTGRVARGGAMERKPSDAGACTRVLEHVTFGMPDLPPNRLIEGDAATVAACLPDGCAGVLYADPPFFSGKRRTAPGGAGFDDSHPGGLAGYLEWLRPLLVEFHRLLSESGTLYLHLDWRAVHYVKVELDAI